MDMGDAVVGCLEVEVQGLNGAFYRAFVLDLVENDVVIGFEDNWLPNKRVPVSRIRLPDHSERQLSWERNEDVEVLSRAKDTEACGWWPAIILDWSRGTEICTIQYKVDKNFTEVVNVNRLRPPNKNPPLQAESFFKCVIEVPEEVRHACEDMALHRDLLVACRASILRGDNKTGTLTLLSTSSDTVTRARMLADLHVRSLQTKVMLKQRGAAAAAASLMGMPQMTRPFPLPEIPNNPRLVTETFSIEPSLMGLAIGTKGSNIQQCRSMPGIHSIEVNEHTCTFKITGNTTREVLDARKRLEYHCEVVYIPKAYTGRVIGKNGQKIQEIVAKSNVLRVSIGSEDENGQVPFQFTGLKESVETAKIVLEYQLANFKELEALVSPSSKNARFSPLSPNAPSSVVSTDFPDGTLYKEGVDGKASRGPAFPTRMSSGSSDAGAGVSTPNGNGIHDAQDISALTGQIAGVNLTTNKDTGSSPRSPASGDGTYHAHPRATAMRSMSASTGVMPGSHSPFKRTASTSILPENSDYNPSTPVVVNMTNGSTTQRYPLTAATKSATINEENGIASVSAADKDGIASNGISPSPHNKENVDVSASPKAGDIPQASGSMVDVVTPAPAAVNGEVH
eukprot:scpid49141/ scgid26292/ Fragile X mental retardation syndrome-related protein 1